MKTKESNHSPIAIIGMGCFFPKSSNLQEYWRLLLRAEDAISEVPPTHWSAEDYYNQDPKALDQVYCTRGGFLSPTSFDPSEYGIPPASIEATDTSQLLGLMAAKMALADAGYNDNRDFNRDKTSVILGVTGTQELVIPLGARLGHPKWRKALTDSGVPQDQAEEVVRRISDAYVPWQENSFPGLLGNVVAGRICNRLNLGGTNCVVDAACASSFSALNLAVLELAAGRSDMVITGGVDSLNDIFMHMCFSKTQILSRSGDIRPFSSKADGTVLGEGVGLLVLKRLQDAEKDADRIYAVIKGIGSSSDGKSQSIYSPRPEGQIKALGSAYKNADIEPATVELIEAHGTGTRVGDKVELTALTRVFDNPARNGFKSALGSVKSNIGHTKAAAGSAGLIKAALALHHKVLPSTLKVDEPDPDLQIDHTPFYLNTITRPWVARKNHPRRAGVSAFGFGGSNFHVVLEEYTRTKTATAWDGSVDIFAFSAPDQENLAEQVQQVGETLKHDVSDISVRTAAFQTREHFSVNGAHRLMLVSERGKNISDLLNTAIAALKSQKKQSKWELPGIYYGGSVEKGKIAFLFPGQGSQYVGMGRDIMCLFPSAMAALQKSDIYYPGKINLSRHIHPQPVFHDAERQAQELGLRQTDVAQPAIGTVSLAMLKILREFGVHPDATCGHSFGELTALHSAGWIDENTFLKLAVSRGKFMAAAGQEDKGPNGAMLAVLAPLDKLDKLIHDKCSRVVMANRNSPEQGVLSGPVAEIDKAEAICRAEGYNVIRLPVAAAFHSELVKSAQKPFAKSIRKFKLKPTDVPVYANATGTPYPVAPNAASSQLEAQMVQPVNFVAQIENLYQSGVRTFVEVGPKSVLTGLVKTILKNREYHSLALDASSGKRNGLTDLANVLSRLASLGHPVALNNWEQALAENPKQRMSIPISGANVWKPKNNGQRAEVSGLGSKNENQLPESKSSKPEDRRPAIETTKLNINAQTKPENSTVSDMTKDDPNNKEYILDALQVVQQGLKSMQELQAQTAQAHQKFLETQTAAGKTLQEMMRNTERLTQAALGVNGGSVRQDFPADFQAQSQASAPPLSARPETRDLSDRTLPSPVNDSHQTVIEKPAIEPQKTSANTQPGMQITNTQSPGISGSEIQTTLLAVVSDLTGYPVDMLDLNMDIEADLGIDSIKRVEILSTLEEKMPRLPSVSPDVMGTLKTLGQITDHFSESQDAPATRSGSGQNSISANRQGDVAAGSNSVNDGQKIETTLLSVVSDLTGYPVDMLDLNMDIEADLGIDSIKRVEILSTLEEKMPQLPSVSPDVMGTLKTLGQIIDFLAEGSNRTAPEQNSAPPVSVNPVIHLTTAQKKTEFSAPLPDKPQAENVQRYRVKPISADAIPSQNVFIPEDRKVFVTDDGSGLSQAIIGELSNQNIPTVLISLDILNYRKDLPAAAGLVIVPDLSSEQADDDLKDAFFLAQHLAADLLKSAGISGAFLATVTRMDGAFGFTGKQISNPVHGGLAGLIKTAAIEWPQVNCRAVDIAPDWKNLPDIARAVVAELLTRGPSEIGLTADARKTLSLEPSLYPTGEIDLSQGDVVVVSGGARGVTAEAALALAKEVHPTLVLLGRSPAATPEPQWLVSLTDEKEIKKAIIENEFSAAKPIPADIESAYKKHLANREITRNLESLKGASASVSYYTADVRDADQICAAFDEVRKNHGPIRAVIHGAGVLEDRLITEKTAAQFARVFDTKVKGLRALLKATGDDPLKYLILFSSVSARMGNKGQADYAMANETLNKVARQEAQKRSNCRAISINWGPWDGGMVSNALKREFNRQGVQLIPLKTGVACMLAEMRTGNNHPVEVVIGGPVIPGDTARTEADRSADPTGYASGNGNGLSQLFERELDVESFPILKSHVIDGQPVVPMALMTEWFGHAALHENPGLSLQGFDDLRILSGIRLNSTKKKIRLLAGKLRPSGEGYEVDVELRNGVKNGKEVIHSRARVYLTDKLEEAPVFNLSEHIVSLPYPKKPAEVYQKILFHGSQLHGIKNILSCSPGGMAANVIPAPTPSEWMQSPLRNQWLADPLVLDSAFQIASLWCFEQKGMVSLPSYSASYRQYCRRFPDGEVTVVLEVHETTEHKMQGDFTFLDSQKKVVARLTGYEAVMDESLYKAFKPEYAQSA